MTFIVTEEDEDSIISNKAPLKENAPPFLKEGCDFDYKEYKNQKIKNQF